MAPAAPRPRGDAPQHRGLHGVAAFRDQLDEKLDVARQAYVELSADRRLEVPWEPDLTVVPFRLAGADDPTQERFLDVINGAQRVLLSPTHLQDRVTLRLAILSHRTHRDRVDEALRIIRDAATAATASRSARSAKAPSPRLDQPRRWSAPPSASP